MFTFKIYFVLLFLAIPAASLLGPGVFKYDTHAISSEESGYHSREKRQLFFDAGRDLIFYLFVQSSQTVPEVLKLNDAHSIEISRFIIHGYQGNVNSDDCSEIREAYFQIGYFNIIVVDWSKGADSLYGFARNQVENVGRVVAQFLDFLNGEFSLHAIPIYLIGYDLGAHIAGFAGKFVTSRPIDTIFGLDPSLPGFQTTPSAKRLNSTDATYVEIIHTNAGANGFAEPIGNASFYMNDGFHQNGCFVLINGCSHRRAHAFFSESIYTTVGFIGHKCGNYQQIIQSETCTSTTPPGPDEAMGGEPSRKGRTGVYYVPTKGSSPYAVGPF